jgi:hypothetical protein
VADRIAVILRVRRSIAHIREHTQCLIAFQIRALRWPQKRNDRDPIITGFANDR